MATIENERTLTGIAPGVSDRSKDVLVRSQDETKLSLKTTEFWAMGGVIAAILIAAAMSDSLGDVRAWTLVAGVAAAYIISRGLAKSGSSHSSGDELLNRTNR